MGVIAKTKSMLLHTLRIKDLGKLKYFMGFEVTRTKKGIQLCQRKYVLDILNESKMLNNKPCPIPLMNSTKVLFYVNEPTYNIDSYRY